MRLKLLGILLGATALLLALALFSAARPEVALADGGPHGGYQDTSSGLTDRCAGCHRVHQGISEGKLLKAESQYTLCLTCHNGAGSVLNVLDGVRLGGVGGAGYPSAANLVGQDSGVIARTNNSSVAVSLAPSGDVAVPVTSTDRFAYFTVRIRNLTAADMAPTLSAADAALGSTPAGRFGASDFVAVTQHTDSPTGDAENPGNPTATTISSVNVPANSVGYALVRTKPLAAAANGDSILTTVTVNVNGTSAVVKGQTRVATSVDSAILNGGGFNFVGSAPTTSRHNANPADNARNPWGFGGTSVTANYAAGGTGVNTGENPNQLSEPLQCTSCHNPHGNSNYRMLKTFLNGNYAYPVTVQAYYNGSLTANEGARGLEGSAPADKYTKEYYGSEAANTAGFGQFCGGCHTAYPSDGAGGNPVNSSMSAVLHYRHRTEMPYTNWTNPNTGSNPSNPESTPLSGFPALRLASNSSQSNTIVTCLTCHRAHGSAATMSGYALKGSLGGLADEELTPSQTSESRSSLLYTNNRGMCEACHQW